MHEMGSDMSRPHPAGPDLLKRSLSKSKLLPASDVTTRRGPFHLRRAPGLEKSHMNEKSFAHTPLDQETRPNVTTAAAAFYLCRQEQTLRIWACKDNGPIRPIRIHGRLAWPVRELRRLLHCDSVALSAEPGDRV